MDEENIKSWVAQPDVCRCCLAASGTWDLSASYISDLGLKEVYADMLRECYGISLSCLSEWGPSHLVCTLCVEHLREAYNFRKQVLKAEEHFTEHYNNKNDILKIKLEVDEYHNDAHEFDDTQDDGPVVNMEVKVEIDPEIPGVPIEENSQKIRKPTRKRKKTVKSTKKAVNPKRKVSKKNGSLDILEQVDEKLDKYLSSKYNGTSDNDISSLAPEVSPAKDLKIVSERSRIIQTCATVVKDTNACPFRHRKSWFQCFFCAEEYMTMTLLREHFAECHLDVDAELRKMNRFPRSLQIDITNLECRLCRISLTDVGAMRRHFESVHQKLIYDDIIADFKINSSPYVCHLCQQEFHVFRNLTTHLNEHYANCICDVCGRSFINSKRLRVHARTHENGAFPCSECGKVLKTKTSRANHIESAHSKRQLICQICHKPMKHYNDRIKHMSEVHNITHVFKCNICSKEYIVKHYLATHMRQTHGNKNKKCPDCDMAFITNHGLKKHMVKHSGIKPYKCDICGKAYGRSYTLREHMRTHECDK